MKSACEAWVVTPTWQRNALPRKGFKPFWGWLANEISPVGVYPTRMAEAVTPRGGKSCNFAGFKKHRRVLEIPSG